MAIVSVLKWKKNIAFVQSKKFMSFLSNDGWSKLASLPETNDLGKPTGFYDYRFFLRDVQQLTGKPLEGKTTGEVPKWIKGSLLQNGPGKFKFGDSQALHWFDGSSVIQKFSVNEGKVSYNYQLLNTETLRRNTKANKHVVSEFATPALPDPCNTIFQRLQSKFIPFITDNTAVSIYPIDGNLYALTETPKIHQLNVAEVKSSKMVDLSKNFKIMSMTAHPHVTQDGAVYNASLAKGEKGAQYAIYMIPNKNGKGGFEESKIVARVPCTWPMNPGYMHSFGITDNHFVIIEQPLTISVKSILFRPFLKKGLTDVFRWKDLPVNFHLLNRKNGDRVVYKADTFFFFHTINQYEDNGHLVMDVCTYDTADVINAFMIDAMKGKDWAEIFSKTFSGRPLRYVLPLKTEGSGNLIKLPNSKATAEKTSDGTVHLKPEKLCDEFCELPRFDYDLLGKKYKYFYGISFSDKINATGKIVKVNVDSKRTEKQWCEEGTAPSEPIFIPSPNAKSEDDGIILFSVLSATNEEQVTLVILDSRNFKELSRTTFLTPGPVPKTIHGWFA